MSLSVLSAVPIWRRRIAISNASRILRELHSGNSLNFFPLVTVEHHKNTRAMEFEHLLRPIHEGGEAPDDASLAMIVNM